MTDFSPTRFPFSIVGFDLDGTLVDTSADLAAAVNHALTTDGRAALPVAAITPMIGGGARHMLAQALGGDEAAVDRLLPALLDFYAANIAVHSRPFLRVVETVDALRALGVICAVVTNKRRSFANKLLQALGLLDRFACVIGGDTLGAGRSKPAPDPILAMIEQCGGGRAAFVGDSVYDVMAAKAAGTPVVACSFGFLDRPVAALGADATIDDYAQLIPVLTRLGAT
ncbi:HAD-IA family hydrolase [Sphingomonas sp.]|uniref:HAD-IA family hydrolase n=1 Tax=Sphingomonas sp. TaxID=28214 RepID=UPI003CC55393